MAPTAAAIGAEIEAGPVISLRHFRRRRLIKRRDRQIGRGRALHGKERADGEASGDNFLDHWIPGLTSVGAVTRAVCCYDFTHNFVTPGLPLRCSQRVAVPLLLIDQKGKIVPAPGRRRGGKGRAKRPQ